MKMALSCWMTFAIALLLGGVQRLAAAQGGKHPFLHAGYNLRH